MRLRAFYRLLAPYRRRINLLVTRGVVKLINAQTRLQSLQVKSIGGEVLDSVEHFESYGFTSHPHSGSESLLLSLQGNRSHTVAVCVADRRYRLTGLDKGEVALHDDLGNVIHLMRDRLKIEAVQHLEVSAPTCEITSITTHEGDFSINGTLVVNGDTSITGTLTVGALITGGGGLAVTGAAGMNVEGDINITSGNVIADGINLKNHTHPENDGGNTGTPN